MMSRLTMDISISHQVLQRICKNILTFILEFVLIKTLNDRGVDALSHPQLLLDLSYFLYRYPGYHLPRVLPFIGPNFLAGCNSPICKRLKASVSSFHAGVAGGQVCSDTACLLCLPPAWADTCLPPRPPLHRRPLLNTFGCLPWPFAETWKLYQ